MNLGVGLQAPVINALQFSHTALVVSQNSSNLIAVTLKAPVNTDTLVTLTVTSTDGSNPSRVHLSSTTVTIPAGQLSTDVQVSVDPSNTFDNPAQYSLLATTASSDVQLQNANLPLTVNDFGVAPIISITNASASTTATNMSFTITLTPLVAVDVPVVVTYNSANSTAIAGTDYQAVSGSVTFAVGETSKTVTVPIINMNVATTPKTFSLKIASPTVPIAAPTATGTLYSPTTTTQIEQNLTQADPARALPVKFSLVFSQPIDPATLTTSDITQAGTAAVTAWSLSTSDNQNWVVQATGISADGTVQPTLAAGAAANPIGAPTSASQSVDNTVTYDTTPPTVTIEQAVSQADPTVVFPILFNVTFSEPIIASGFTTATITQSGNAAGVTWAIVNSGDNTHFTLKATAATAYGTVKPTLAANLVTDLAGNGNVASTSVDNQVSYGMVVLPIYEAYGGDWNSYVKNDGTTLATATGTACTGTEANYQKCIHGGELKKVILPGVTNCSGLALTDNLGLFTSACDDSSGLATFYAALLNKGKGLRDIVKTDGSGWKTNYVILTGSITNQTPALNWWPNNPVLPLPDNSLSTATVQTLTTPKAVYTLTASRASQGYNIGASQISLVTLNGAVLSYGGSSTQNCNWGTGLTTPVTAYCLVASGSETFLWIEADINGYAASQSSNYGYFFANASNIRLQNSLILNGGWSALEIHYVDNAKFESNRSSQGSYNLYNSNGNLFYKTQLEGGSFNLNAATNNNIALTNISQTYVAYALNAGSTGNSFTRATMANLNYAGMQPNSTSETNNIMAFLTIANISQPGIAYYNGSYNTFHNVLITNAGNQGFVMFASYNSLSHLAFVDNVNDGIQMTNGSSYNKFSGLLLTGNNSTGACNVSGGTSPGLNSSCVGINASAGLLTPVSSSPAFSSASSYIGKVTSDAVNTSAASGIAAHPSNTAIFDWLNFYNPFSNVSFNPMRSWGLQNSAAFPSYLFRNTWTSGEGQIWDFSLLATDPTFLNKTANGTTANTAIIANTACPAWLGGNVTVTDLSGHTFLANAYEIIDDNVGNDNGLCESGEACVAAPNFGSYQGHGDPMLQSCIFSDGTVTGVKMYYMPNNGF